MEQLVRKYARKLLSAGLADNPLICGLDDEIVWNQLSDDISVIDTATQKVIHTIPMGNRPVGIAGV